MRKKCRHIGTATTPMDNTGRDSISITPEIMAAAIVKFQKRASLGLSQRLRRAPQPQTSEPGAVFLWHMVHVSPGLPVSLFIMLFSHVLL